jgi:hypothetical protein
MDLEALKKNRDYLAAQMAYYSAANAVTLGEASGALNWPFLGEDRPEALGDTMFDYSGFVRANPTAPAEALYRFGAGRQHHSKAGEKWTEADFVWRSAFTVFHRTLPIFDELLSAEIAALEAAEAATTAAPTLAALSLPAEDTILERFGTIFETSPNMALQTVETEPELGVEVAAPQETNSDQAEESIGAGGATDQADTQTA